jgi:hypothetical protein
MSEYLTLNVKKGKDFGLRSVSVSSDKKIRENGPITQIAVYIEVTSDNETEPSVGRCR